VKKIGLFFGTFDPIHKGHLQLANYFANKTDIDKVWFVITPQNPFKKDKEILPDQERLELVKRALIGHSKLQVSTVEFLLPKPSYTFNTLCELKKQHPDKTFVLLLGEDLISDFKNWKNYDKILTDFSLYVYPRKHPKNTIPKELQNHPSIHWVKAEYYEISSSQIRAGIKMGNDMSAYLPKNCWEYMKVKQLYD
jgi:nicotinate-nucleotide adenylyltransferase